MIQKGKSRNVLASPLGEEGHEVAKGWTRVRMIMILLFYVLSPFAQGAADWRSGPLWSIISVLCPVHPFPLRGTSPRWEACHWIRGSRGSPMNPVPLPPPQAGALWVLSNGAMSLQESIERFILSPGWGGKGTRFVREQSDLRIV